MKNLLLTLLILLLAPLCVMANIYDDFDQFKYDLYNSVRVTKEDFEEFINNHKSEYNKLSEEDKLVIDTKLLIEKMNFVMDDTLVQELFKANKAFEEHLDKVGKDEVSSKFMSTFGDLKSRYLNFVSKLLVVSESMKAKDYYKSAVKKDKHNIDAYIGHSMWLYYAPFIAGGSNKSALKMIRKAEKQAETDLDRYFLYIYESQYHLVLDDEEEARKALKKANELFEGEIFSTYLLSKMKDKKPFF